MDAFPTELFQGIIGEILSISDLRTLRTVNKTFNELATPRVFRIVVIIDTPKGVEALKQIKRCVNLCFHVKEIHFLYDVRNDTDGHSALYLIYA